MKQQDLLIYGKHYICASYTHPDSPTMLYAVFRDVTDDGQRNYVLENVFGPWVNSDGSFDTEWQSLFDEASTEVMRLFHELREVGRVSSARWVPKSWQGRVVRFNPKPDFGVGIT
jgi:hypothetical protein